jgi:CRISPR/Cas system-associated endonuclease Cas1
MVVYIKTQGARIVKEGRHLLVKKGEDICHTLFTYKLSQIVIFGNVEITHRALAQIMRNEIDTVFINGSITFSMTMILPCALQGALLPVNWRIWQRLSCASSARAMIRLQDKGRTALQI